MIHAQTNTFPDDGNVGVGTTNPYSKIRSKWNPTIQKLFIESIKHKFPSFYKKWSRCKLLINQISNNSAHPILRLSSGTATANQGVKFTIENDGNVGVNTAIP